MKLKTLATYLLVAGTVPLMVQGEDKTIVTPDKETEDDCSLEMLHTFFPKKIVRQALEDNEIPKDQWDAITTDLTEKDKNIVPTLQKKAAELKPNPLLDMSDSTQRGVAFKLFREILLDTFTQVMKAHGVQDDEKIMDILDDIDDARAKLFEACIDKGLVPPPSQKQSAPTTANK